MIELAQEEPRIGLVFATRKVVAETERRWPGRRSTRTRTSISTGLTRVNDGRFLFEQMVDAGLEENWIGEPSAVLVARRALEHAGTFNIHVHQVVDLDLWLRIMIVDRVGFIDRPLSTYRRHGHSVSAVNRRRERDWLDRLWLLEGSWRRRSKARTDRGGCAGRRSSAQRGRRCAGSRRAGSRRSFRPTSAGGRSPAPPPPPARRTER
jgi:hypothetical protein